LVLEAHMEFNDSILACFQSEDGQVSLEGWSQPSCVLSK
jgi:hypothetical protein